MSHVSADNARLTELVGSLRAAHTQFQTAMRGAVVEALAGLSNGTLTMLTMNQSISDVTVTFISTASQIIKEDLGELADRSIATSKGATEDDAPFTAQDVAQSLVDAFTGDLERDISYAAGKAQAIASQFVTQQLAAGRAFATTDQLQHDMEFKMNDRAGKQLDIGDFVFRQANWVYRSVYNHVMVYILLSNAVDDAKVDGGSKDGTVLDLNNFDQIAPTYFHHNSKSLLQPLD